jgi:hypothetical protein
MCDNSHSFASASSEGSVHVVRVDMALRTADGRTPQRSGSEGMLAMAGAASRKTGATSVCAPTAWCFQAQTAGPAVCDAGIVLALNVEVCAVTGVRVSGSSVVRTLEEDEGPVLTISHLNTATASLLVYGTQKGVDST